MTKPITIGVSACLLGEHVRYDGGHKYDRYIADTLGRFFSFVPVCPEVECGLPIPREVMQLEGDPAAPRLMTRQTRSDMTGTMLFFCSDRIRELSKEDLCGFIFKERSPSCGLTMVPLFDGSDYKRIATGLFANEIVRCFPSMPLVEAGRLNNPCIRENFIERVYLYRSKMSILKNYSYISILT